MLKTSALPKRPIIEPLVKHGSLIRAIESAKIVPRAQLDFPSLRELQKEFPQIKDSIKQLEDSKTILNNFEKNISANFLNEMKQTGIFNFNRISGFNDKPIVDYDWIQKIAENIEFESFFSYSPVSFLKKYETTAEQLQEEAKTKSGVLPTADLQRLFDKENENGLSESLLKEYIKIHPEWEAIYKIFDDLYVESEHEIEKIAKIAKVAGAVADQAEYEFSNIFHRIVNLNDIETDAEFWNKSFEKLRNYEFLEGIEESQAWARGEEYVPSKHDDDHGHH